VIAIGDTKNPAGKPVLEQAFGYADLDRRTELTPRHRFRVASAFEGASPAPVL